MKTQKNEILEKWEELARQDLQMAELAFSHGIYLQAAFHVQQSVEKSLKGMIIFLTQKEAPYTHDLVRLYQVLEAQSFYDIKYIDELSGLNPYYILARYPSYKENLSEGLTKSKIEYFLKISKGVLLWLEQSKKS
jgi:HEPN domain-containing protein